MGPVQNGWFVGRPSKSAPGKSGSRRGTQSVNVAAVARSASEGARLPSFSEAVRMRSYWRDRSLWRKLCQSWCGAQGWPSITGPLTLMR